MPAAKLGDPNARAKCGQCQQVFFLNANLISNGTPIQQPAPQSQARSTTRQQALPSQTQEDLSIPAIPRRAKRAKPVATEGMIHDEMDGTNTQTPQTTSTVAFSDDELDSFLNENINFVPRLSKSTKDEMADNEDEAWLKDLLNDKKPVVTNAQTTTSTTTSPIINEVDLNAVIPVAVPKPKKPISIKQIESNTPTTQQLAEKKSLGSQLAWVVGCVLLVALLGVQYALFNAKEIAKNPESAGLAHTLCGIIPCRIPSAELSSLNINATLQNQKDVIITINNTSNTEQLYPYLLVQLKDKNNAVVADFVADTKDYLSESQTTLLAGQHKRIMLSVNTNTNASSVTVKPFYQQP